MFIQFQVGSSSIYIKVDAICSVEKGKFGTHITTIAGKEHQVSENLETVIARIKAAK